MSLAFGDLSEDTMEVLWTDPLARKHWRPFFRAVGAYQQAYDQSWEDSDGEVYDDDDTQITLCDNIDHGEVDGRHMLAVDAVKCSWCQAVVYCSEKCQRYDWKKLHREECTRDRMYRIDRQLNGAWICHRNRMLIFRVHELFLQKAVPLMASLPPSPAGKPVPFMDHTTLPLSMKVFDMQCLKTLAQDGVPIYGDKRSQALIKEYEDDESDTIRLAGGIAPNGQYMVAILGSFVVEPKVDSDSDEESKNDGSPTGDPGAEGDSEEEESEGQSEELPNLTLKNGYIRIIAVANPDKACEMEFHRGMTGIMRLSFEPPDESDAYDSD
ncbi:hypothetical protein NMY22_g20257 [Coprinellus aureogranulatus]|nr:hypothetical protein NMY22_g20257 [Coprinellus aureogranulatus]